MENDLTDIQRESGEQTLEEALDGGQKETAADSSPEDKPVEGEPSQGGENTPGDNVPFHKHPRWKEMHDRNKAMEAELSALRDFRESQEKRSQETESQRDTSQTPKIPKWFSDIHGTNVEAWQEYLSGAAEQRNGAVQEAIRQIESKQQQQAQAQQQAQTYVDEQIQTLKDVGHDFDNNELLKIVADYRPINEQGNWDFVKAHEILMLKKSTESKEKSSARKSLAASTMSKGKGGTEPDKTDGALSIGELRKAGGFRAWRNT